MSEWWRGAVIYQIYPRSFQDSDGDGIGDLKGITRRLTHVADLGADAIWLSPIFTSPMEDMGYDVSDYTDIDPMFGTLADFDTLVEKAHDLGLKVIVDQVISHSAAKHPWFEESRSSRDNPKADWYVWADPKKDGSPPNNWPSVFGGPAWEWEPRRKQYYLHNFLISQPDLNFHNPEVQDAMIETMRFWLDRGVDGFRLDTVNYYFHDAELRDNPPAPDGGWEMATDVYGMQDHKYSKTQPENLPFLERLRNLTDQYDDRMMVGEVGEHGQKSIDVMAEYTRGEKRLHMAYSFAMLGPQFSPDHFRTCIEGFLKGAPDGWPSWSFSNHDVPRHVTRWAEHGENPEALARLCIALLMSFEGTIGIYQGEELGQTETELVYEELTDPPALRFWPEVKGRDGCRTPMVWEANAPHGGFTTGTPWLPVKPPQQARAVNGQGADGILQFYKDVIAFRRQSPALKAGRTEFLSTEDPVFAFIRKHDDQALTCLFNLSPLPQELTLDGEARATALSRCKVKGSAITLPPNGFGWLDGKFRPT